MIFQHTWQKVLSGDKTQTRRLVKPGEFAANRLGRWIPNLDAHNKEFEDLWLELGDVIVSFGPRIMTANSRTKWQVGASYAVQEGRGKPGVERIQIIRLRQEDVRQITIKDAIAEGFESNLEFLSLWSSMHDGNGFSFYYEKGVYHVWHKRHWQEMTLEEFVPVWMNRPAERYLAWVLEFRLVSRAGRETWAGVR